MMTIFHLDAKITTQTKSQLYALV